MTGGLDLDGDEFDDVAADDPTPWQGVDWATLRQPQVLQAVVALAASIGVLLAPDLADETVAVVIAGAVAVISLIWLVRLARDRRLGRLTLPIIGLLAAGFVITARRSPDDALALLVGVGAILVGAYRLARGRGRLSWSPAVGSLLLIGCGVLAVGFPDLVFRLTLVTIAGGAGFFAVVAIAVSLDPTVDGVASLADSEGLIQAWLSARHKTADNRRALYDKILFEGPATGRRLARFFILMAFAAVIASMGVLTDSTAVVIGAMLIAPLMTPLMGTAISLIMGWPGRLRRSALVAAGGIGMAIFIGLVIGLVAPTEVDTLANAQIVSRSNPTMLDLIIALAAGAAGAYGLSRPDVSDALPGVAVAISLVPPLAVAGIAYGLGDPSSGNGALLLFTTNMLAILAMGGLTFVLTGVTPLARLTEQQDRLRSWMGAVAVAGLAVVGALALNGAEITRNSFEHGRVEAAVADWVDDAEQFTVAQVIRHGDMVTVVVVGPAEGLPTTQALADGLSSELDREVTAVVRHVVEVRDQATGRAGS